MNLKNILVAELIKFKYTTCLKISIIIMLLYGIICAIPFRYLIEKYSDIDMGANMVNKVFGYNASFSLDFSSIFMFILPFFIVHFFTSEFTKKTIKNVVGLGINRTVIFLAKYIAFFIAILVLFILWGFFSTVLFSIVNGWGVKFSVVQIPIILLEISKMAFIQLAYATFPVIASFVIYNSGVIVAILFGSSIVGSIIISFMNRLDSNIGTIISFLFPDRYMNQFIQISAGSGSLLGGIISIAFNIMLTIGISLILFKKINIYT